REALSEAAQIRANEISTYYDTEYMRPDGRDCFSVLDDVHISYTKAGENMASGYKSPEKVVECWLNSPGHSKNILDPAFTHIGVGLVSDANDEYGYYWTQIFIKA
ncbi:MAG: CAP domain-containing protein, partial [Firmicutes bacterium]|nr:CAP domain-containing protein [Bacillota bacterium]